MDFEILVGWDQSGPIAKSAQIAPILIACGLLMPSFMFATELRGNPSLSHGIDPAGANETQIAPDYSIGVNNTLPPTGTIPGGLAGSGGASDLDRRNEREYLMPCPLSVVHCTQSGSPFTQNNVNQGSNPVLGTASDGGSSTPTVPGTVGGTVSTVAGTVGGAIPTVAGTVGSNMPIGGGAIFTAFSNPDSQQILADLGTRPVIVNLATATIGVANIPEPKSMSLLLIGAGLFAVPLIYRRRFRP